MASSSPPSEKERDWYYFGLSGTPKLIARTSTDKWSPGQEGNWSLSYRRKEFSAIVDHNVVTKWTKTLSLALVAALDGHPWAWFLPIRIGFASSNRRQAALIERTDYPVVLLVAMNEALPWDTAILVAAKCRCILRKYQIHDVEVEIQECGYQPCGASRELETAIDNNAWMLGTSTPDPNTNTLALPMLSYPGYPVTYLDGPKKQGSMGAYFKLGNDPAVYGLTCRHVVCHDRADNESYKFNGHDKQRHAQASGNAYQDVLQTFTTQEKDLRVEMKRLQDKKDQWESWYIYDETKQGLIFSERDARLFQDVQQKLAYHSEIFELVKKAKELESRSIGHLTHHCSFEVSTKEPGYLKDWGLIKLDHDKFPNGFQNKVFIGNAFNFAYESESALDCNGFLSLSLESRGQDSEKAFWVGKQGATTGLTIGIRSSIEAVVRRHTNGSTCLSWEAPVVSKPGDTRGFTEGSDSGSCIFDTKGRIVGLVVGRTMAQNLDRKMKARPADKILPEKAEETPGNVLPQWPSGIDITFSSPIEWVLSDIKSFTGSEPYLI